MGIDEILKSPVLPKGPAARVRIVLRRGSHTSREIDAACRGGQWTVDGREVCELTANGSVIATGRIVERDGSVFFEGGTDGSI